MCLLAASFSKIKNIEALENGFCNNSHGAGFCYSDNNRLFVEKGFFTFEEFIEAYNKIPDESANLVHFRLATGGKINEENCHPFYVNENLAFAHNGVFGCVNSTALHSDTYEFNRLLLQPLFNKNTNYMVFKPEMKYLLEKTIGYNKVAFLNNSGKIAICNEDNGDWNDGIWWSNSGWKHSNKRCWITSEHVKSKPSSNKSDNPTWQSYLEECYSEFRSMTNEE